MEIFIKDCCSWQNRSINISDINNFLKFKNLSPIGTSHAPRGHGQRSNYINQGDCHLSYFQLPALKYINKKNDTKYDIIIKFYKKLTGQIINYNWDLYNEWESKNIKMFKDYLINKKEYIKYLDR